MQSSSTSVKLWPTPDAVVSALRIWSARAARERPGLVGLGYFGSYARGHAGFGSDLDLVAVVKHSDVPRMERNRDWPYERLPVPADLLVFTVDEWRQLMARGGRFAGVMKD